MINKILSKTTPYFRLVPSIAIDDLRVTIENLVQLNLWDTDSNIFSYFFQEVTHQSHISIHSSEQWITNDTLLSVMDDASLVHKITVWEFVKQMNRTNNPTTENQKFITLVRFFEENDIGISFII